MVQAQNPYAQFGYESAAPASPQVIEGPPRQPAPQTAPQARGDELQNTRTQQQIDAANRDAANAPQEREYDRLNRIGQLRQEFNQRPEVRQFMQLRNASRQIEQLGRNDTAQNDMAIIFSFMRTLDPTSVVREGEFANAQNTAGVPEQVRNMYNRALNGERLSPTQRQEMINTARSLYRASAQGYNETAAQYHQLLRDFGEQHPGRQIPVATGAMEAEARENAPQPERDIGFSGRTISRDTVPLTAEQMNAYNEFMGQQQRGQLTPEALSAAYQRITGRPILNARDIAEYYNQTGTYAPLQSVSYQNVDARELAQRRNEMMGQPGTEDLLFHGATLGFSDEAAGVGEMARNALSAPFTNEDFDPAAAYTRGRDAESIRLDQARERTGLLGTVAEIGGGFGAGTIGRVMNLPATVGGRMIEGARTGAQVGAVAGAGYAEPQSGSIDPLGAARGAITGALTGGAIGGAIPAVTAGAGQVVNAGRTLLGRDPNVAQRTISEAIAADANTPVGAGERMTEAQANGVPMMLADTGDNARGLLAASARSPGPARTLARDALEERQGELADRVTRAIERDLGPVSNPHQVADDLMSRARTDAAPLYEEAYAAPGAGAVSERMEPLLARPSMRRALARAYRIAQEEGRDPTALGFDLNQAGEPVLTRTNSWQTLDYVKRGLDDVLQSQPRNPATGRLILDEDTRAIQGTLRQLLRTMDSANPAYARARAAWSGPVRARDAMDLGRRALNMTGDDLTARTRDMSPSEMDFFRLGYRRAMAEQVASRGDQADVVRSLVGTGKKRAALARLFGGREEFNRFVATLQAEQEGFRTFNRAMQGSPTAQNVQDDAALGVAAPLMLDMATTGTPLTTAIREAWRFGARRAGSNARQDIAALLSETSPTRLAEFARELQEQTNLANIYRQRSARRVPGYGIIGGEAGASIADAYLGRR